MDAAHSEHPPVDFGSYNQFPWAPSIDPQDTGPVKSTWRNDILRVMTGRRVLLGCDLHEGGQFVPEDVQTEAQAIEMLEKTFGAGGKANAERLWKLYGEDGGVGDVQIVPVHISDEDPEEVDDYQDLRRERRHLHRLRRAAIGVGQDGVVKAAGDTDAESELDAGQGVAEKTQTRSQLTPSQVQARTGHVSDPVPLALITQPY